MKKNLHSQKYQKSNLTIQKRHQNFDITTITDRLRTDCQLSNNNHPTGVVKPVNGYPTLDLFAGAYHSWIGGTDLMKENSWRWQNSGRIIKLAGWSDNQPTGNTAANCLLTHQNYEHRWIDNPCKNKYHYVCEKHGELETIDFKCIWIYIVTILICKRHKKKNWNYLDFHLQYQNFHLP